MSEYKRLSTQSQVYNGATLIAFYESCGEDDCRAFCVGKGEEPKCDICPVQKAFEKLKRYEDIGSPEELHRFAEVYKQAKTYVCVDCKKVFDFKDVDGDSAELCPFCGYDTLLDITRMWNEYEEEK